MTADDVIAFLKAHPAFFNEHPDTLAQLNLPQPHEGKAISLTERQLLTLREKNRQLEQKLAELLRFGQENDDISEKVHRLALGLVASPDFPTLEQTLQLNFVDDFRVPHVALRLWNSVLDGHSPAFAPVSEAMRLYSAELRLPYCGTPGDSEVIEWFGTGGEQVRSVALMPLRRDAQTFGLLALGSEEAERFFPGMGTLYLGRIAELVSAAVRRHLG